MDVPLDQAVKADIEAQVVAHCEKVFGRLSSPNTLHVYSEHGACAFSGDPSDANYLAARKANEVVYGVEPDLVRSGGSIPVTLTMQATGRSVVLFPIGRGDDGAHSQNEKLDVNQLLAGVKPLAVRRGLDPSTSGFLACVCCCCCCCC